MGLLDKFLGGWFDHRWNKKLSEHNAKIDKKVYVSKVKFDAEFKMYQELSNSCFELVLKVSPLFPIISWSPADEEELKIYRKRLFNESHAAIIVFQDRLFSYAPFISKNIYEKLNNIRLDCKSTISHYDFVYFKSPSQLPDFEKYSDMNEKIQNMHSDFINMLREYLESLDVKD